MTDKHVLVVDDEVSIRDMLTRLFKDGGFASEPSPGAERLMA